MNEDRVTGTPIESLEEKMLAIKRLIEISGVSTQKTLLDEFAIAALIGLIADPNGTGKTQDYVQGAFQIAEAMIAEKKKREESK